jgi:3-methylcrotonyl-CoA carboxylase alpha subunit
VVEKGAPLIVMEAMKMEHTIGAPAAGRVSEVLYAVGDQVTDGAQLLVLEVQ